MGKLPSSEDLPDPGIEPGSPTLQANYLLSETPSTTIGGGLVVKSCPTLSTPWTVAARLLCPWDSPGKNTGVGCHFLLQGIFLTQDQPGSLAVQPASVQN